MVISPEAPASILVQLAERPSLFIPALPKSTSHHESRKIVGRRQKGQAGDVQSQGVGTLRAPCGPSTTPSRRPPKVACSAPPRKDPAWSRKTLFGGEHCANSKVPRGPAGTFGRPCHSRAPPHTRPIFVVGFNGEDPRASVDPSNPMKFSSGWRSRYDYAYFQCQTTSVWSVAERPATCDLAGRDTPRETRETPSPCLSGEVVR